MDQFHYFAIIDLLSMYSSIHPASVLFSANPWLLSNYGLFITIPILHFHYQPSNIYSSTKETL